MYEYHIKSSSSIITSIVWTILSLGIRVKVLAAAAWMRLILSRPLKIRRLAAFSQQPFLTTVCIDESMVNEPIGGGKRFESAVILNDDLATDM